MAPALIVGATLIALTVRAEAQARFELRSGGAYPFPGLDADFYNTPSPVFADIDDDGDYDTIVGDYLGFLDFFENTSSPNAAPMFLYRLGDSNPIEKVEVAAFSAPSFADLDNDGDLDAIVGEYVEFETPVLHYFRNEGSSRSPLLVKKLGLANPLGNLTFPDSPMPALADIDGDRDFDLVVGTADGDIRYFQNSGNFLFPSFTERTGNFNPFNGLKAGEGGNFSAPAFADVDRDGDIDMISGSYEGLLFYFENIGSTRLPRYISRTGVLNPFAQIDTGILSDPTIADLDGDGDVDLLVAGYDGLLRYYENTDPGPASLFSAWQAANFSLPVDAALAVETADPDKDGRSNLVEFGLRTSPRIRSYSPVIRPIINTNGLLSFTATIRDDPGLTVTVEFSDSPEFTESTMVQPIINDPVPGDKIKTATFIDTMPAVGKRERYMRLVFELD
ncbi:MAG: hypothetical protein ACI9R3_003745 [Verrucomicrobiales bacterium]|jgi:hypothetical protein